MSSFFDKIQAKWNEGKFVCVGLDSDYSQLPSSIKTGSIEDSVFNFNKAIIDSTHDLVASYKPNTAFYENQDGPGMHALIRTVEYVNQNYPDIPVILDAKRADIGSTNEGYVQMAFEKVQADAITVHPYLGRDSLEPFFNRADKGIFVLVRTSNPGSNEIQNLDVGGKPLYEIIAENISKSWNSRGNCAVVVGATYPNELKNVRALIGDLPILIPGIGAQGGDLEASVKNGVNSKKQGIIISSSRGIIFASSEADFAEEARKATEQLHNQIQEILSNV